MEDNEVIKITKDERNVHKVGNKVVIKIDQIQEMPIINVRNMCASWKTYNESAKDFLDDESNILLKAIETAKEQSKKLKSKAEDVIAMSDENKIEFLKRLWDKEKKSAIDTLNNFDKIVEATVSEVKKQHDNLLKKVKTEIEHNNKGIKIYSKVL